MKKNLQRALKDYEASIIEIAIVQLFVEANSITVKKNLFIKQFLNDKSEEVDQVKGILSVEIETKNITAFVNIFELLVPQSDKKINGAFFTPRTISDFIVSETIISKDQTICDPSCGCGAFLIVAAEFISEQYKKSIIDVVEENIYGVDLADYSIRRAKILLSLLTLENGEDKQEIDFNLETRDSLVSDWKKLFPKIKEGFDVIIGNPPYVKFQDLNKELREKLYKEWRTLKTGNYNLYFAFFELGINLMKSNGILAYITPNNYFTSLAGVPLREYLASNNLIKKITDFNHLKLFEAQTYTCVTFLNRDRNDFIYYERVDDYDDLNRLKQLKYSKIDYSLLNNKKWRLLRQLDQENIKKIESIGIKLGDLVDIRVGVATCKDLVYFIDGKTLKDGYYHKTYQGEEYKIEPGITNSIVKISDFKDQSELEANSRRIIFPYKRNNGKAEVIKEPEFKEKYPHCYDYFLAAKPELATRDKGSIKYAEWYAYARTQGLNFFGKKLLTPTFSSKPRFLFEQNENALFCNGYAIYMNNRLDLFSKTECKISFEALKKILNSRIMDYYINRTSVSIQGGFTCYQKNFIELLGIPQFSSAEWKFLEKEKDYFKIDEFLINKYGVDI